MERRYGGRRVGREVEWRKDREDGRRGKRPRGNEEDGEGGKRGETV